MVDGEHQILLSQYRLCLRRFINNLKELGNAQMIWATITPLYTPAEGVPMAQWQVNANAEIKEYNVSHGVSDQHPINSRGLTNVGTYREYMRAYVAKHPKITHEMTLMVRQLAPTAQGLPLEVYAFSGDINWVNYENIQSDLFDHFLAVAREFDLEIFQEPSDFGFRRGPNENG